GQDGDLGGLAGGDLRQENVGRPVARREVEPACVQRRRDLLEQPAQPERAHDADRKAQVCHVVVPPPGSIIPTGEPASIPDQVRDTLWRRYALTFWPRRLTRRAHPTRARPRPISSPRRP